MLKFKRYKLGLPKDYKLITPLPWVSTKQPGPKARTRNTATTEVPKFVLLYCIWPRNANFTEVGCFDSEPHDCHDRNHDAQIWEPSLSSLFVNKPGPWNHQTVEQVRVKGTSVVTVWGTVSVRDHIGQHWAEPRSWTSAPRGWRLSYFLSFFRRPNLSCFLSFFLYFRRQADDEHPISHFLCFFTLIERKL